MKSSRHNLPGKVESYGNKDYWENRFLVEDEYDWLCSYESFDSVLQHQLSPDDRILILGLSLRACRECNMLLLVRCTSVCTPNCSA